MQPRLGIALVLLVACGGAAGDAGEPDAATDAPTTDAMPDAPDVTVIETRGVTVGPVMVAPGQEATVCTVVDLGNSDPRMVRGVRSMLSEGTHHVIATLSSAAPTGTLTPCGPFAGGGGDTGILMIAQQPVAALGYPAGAGLPVAAHQSIHLEMHYFNAGDATLAISGAVELDLAAADGNLAPVQLLFTGGTSLHVPAHGTATVTSDHALPAGTRLFATTAHTHQWGRLATVELLQSAGDPAPRLLHTSTNWAERPLDQFAPITIGADARLRLTCTYENLSDADVGFGLSATDEMCFVWAHHAAP